MTKKTKNTVQPVTTPTQEIVATKASDELAVQPVAAAAGITEDGMRGVEQKVGAEVEAAEPAKKSSAAVRMMTKSVAFKKPSKTKGRSERVTDAAKPSQKPAAGGLGKAHRKGASKGR